MADLKVQCQIILNRAKLIYQTHYLSTKLELLAILFWQLDQAISHSDDEKTEQIMKAIRAVQPCNLSDDYMLKLQASNGFDPSPNKFSQIQIKSQN